MVIRKYNTNKTNFISHKTSNVEIFFSTPFPKARRASKLTLRAGNTRLDLSGRQVNALREVLAAGAKASGKKA